MFRKAKSIALTMALAMAISAVSAGGVEVKAASANKVMETNVNFVKDASTGDESSVMLNSVLSKEGITFGKTYAINMKIYVPAEFMKSGRIYVSPNLDFYSGDDNENYLGYAQSEEGYSFDKESEAVTKVDDFYMIDAKMPIDAFYADGSDDASSFPEGTGQIMAGAFVVGEELSYKGSIFFDDVELEMDGAVVASANYENGKAGSSSYLINLEESKTCKPKVVDFTGKALDVTKKSLTVKKGKTATIKTVTAPSAKATFKTSNKKVATVSNKGVVKGIKKGKATITVKANGKTVKVTVTVK